MRFLERLNLRIFFWFVSLSLGFLQFWAYRHSPSSVDIVSYLDISDFYLQGKWQFAINGYWGPLYCWILSLVRVTTTTDPYWEIVIVKLTNLILYLLTFACFDIFLQEQFKHYQRRVENSEQRYKIPKAIFLSLSYVFFIWSTLRWTGVHCDTPDLLTAAFVYLAVALLLRIERSSTNWSNFILLGLVLGFGYLARAAMFHLSFVFFAVAALSLRDSRRNLPKIAAGLLAFTIVVAPFITAISLKEGSFTISTAAKLNQAWKYGFLEDKHWQGDDPSYGKPTHPTRKIFDDPKTFEFATPIEGTYPAWTDPGYWHQGLKFKANWFRRLSILRRSLVSYWGIFLGTLISSYLILAIASERLKFLWQDLKGNWIVLAPALAGLALFMLATSFSHSNFPVTVLQPSTRFLAPFIILLFIGSLTSIQFPDTEQCKKLAIAFSISSLIFMSGSLTVQVVYESLSHLEKHSTYLDWDVAEHLQAYGIQKGEQVAILGDDDKSYLLWARLVKLKIIAQIRSQDEFWGADLDTQKKVLASVQNIGAKAIIRLPLNIVYWPSLGNLYPSESTGWKNLGDTGYSVYILDSSQKAL